VSKSSHSRASEFLHDLITVDFDQVDIYPSVRFATILVPLLVLGLIIKHESSLVILGTICVSAIDLILPIGPRTSTSYLLHNTLQ